MYMYMYMYVTCMLLIAQSRERRDEEQKSHLVQIKEMRDVKRRRASYRAKNVHITQKPIKQVSVLYKYSCALVL